MNKHNKNKKILKIKRKIPHVKKNDESKNNVIDEKKEIAFII